MTKTKICSRCKKEKLITEFNKDKSRKDRVKRYCKICVKIYYQENREKIAQMTKQYYKKYPIKYWCINTINKHKQRGFKVLFTFKDLLPIAKQIIYCPMCGVKLQYSGQRNQSSNASLDRIDNGDILTFKNTQIICRKCNMTKLDRTMQEFVEYCEKVVYRYG